MISVVDYGAGNLKSVCNALEAVGAPFSLVTLPSELTGAKVLLPGVGHFGQMMASLIASGLGSQIRAAASEGIPVFGICLGMQALFESSEEAPDVPGLCLLKGSINRITGAPKLPHMGWNDVQFSGGETGIFYFANSYAAPVGENTKGTFEYGGRLSATVESANISGAQFHPEKSGQAGLDLLREWCFSC